jgi:hypothetical protein
LIPHRRWSSSHLQAFALGVLLMAGIVSCSRRQDGPGSSESTVRPGTAASALDPVRQRLGDRIFQFGSSRGNSDRNAFMTGINQLQLCAFGRFGLKEIVSFSSSMGDTTTEHVHDGTWSLSSDRGQVVLDLKVERSTADEPPRGMQFVVTVSGERVSFDGHAAEESDVTADCEVARRGR